MASNIETNRALDLGMGFVKFTRGHLSDGNPLDVSAFPSYAAEHADNLLSAADTSKLNVLRVKVGDEYFAVGQDVHGIAKGLDRPLLESSFYRSTQYIALARGAMANMEIPERGIIDNLVVGLPINFIRDQDLKDHVRKVLGGIHEVPDLSKESGNREITVKSVAIIPQVSGSLIAMSHEHEIDEQIKTETNLTIDVGYGTLLWLTSHGLVANPARSNGNMGGVSSLLQRVLRAINKNYETNLLLLDKLDFAFRTKQPTLKIDGTVYELAKYEAHLSTAVRENLTELIRSIGSTADIDNIFLTGGGAHFYEDAIKRQFENRMIHTSGEASRFSNVRGFQYLAEE